MYCGTHSDAYSCWLTIRGERHTEPGRAHTLCTIPNPLPNPTHEPRPLKPFGSPARAPSLRAQVRSSASTIPPPGRTLCSGAQLADLVERHWCSP